MTHDPHALIVSDPAAFQGRPVVRGTRLSVEFVLDLLAGGWTERRIVDAFPHPTGEGVRTAIAFALDLMKNEQFVAVSRARAA